MTHAGCDDGETIVADALKMIDLVSCSANGNSCPEACTAEPELLWPRWADRLEAAGEIGVARCYMHNLAANEPLDVAGSTPRPATEAEAWALATEERFALYQSSGGHSDSMIDHYFDKLLQVAKPPKAIVRNAYLEEAAVAGAQPLLDVVLAYGATGKVPVEKIEASIERLGLRR